MKGTTANLFRRIERAHDLMTGIILANLPVQDDENDRSVERVVIAIAPLTATLEERTS
jgi:hypothetical protein